jgi:hypothetical protein
MRLRVFVVLAVAVAVGLATAVSPFASASPDGLERVAEDHGFIAAAASRESPVAGYAFPGIEDERLATGAAGFVGTLATLTAAWGLLALRGRARRR